MPYQYTESNLLENPTHYMYSSFEGMRFIDDFKKSRIVFLENSIIPNLDKSGELNPFMQEIYKSLSASLTSSIEGLNITNLSLKFLEIDTEDSILTENLINYLIASNLSSIKNDERHLEDRLIQKFEVTKKIYTSYAKGMGKGLGDFKDPYLYVIFSIFLASKYLINKNLKFLNTIIKVNDIIASAGNTKKFEGYPYQLVNLSFNLEIKFIEKLISDSGIK